MLTQKAKYGLRALEVLATEAASLPGKPRPCTTMTIGEVAERACVPHKFLEAILLELRRHGFVESRRGKSGGYSLARPADRIGVGDVIRALDGPLAPIPAPA
ncbi:RrF2 family transcriptional regulator [Roseomonas sp. CCTCC AB2023176]|uniref:RrF2 family transcriptional regulator n=1 Tax=Roseomonas sp. CCTCC AB2023176 TaxID=3342640 RepID=UPI0035D6CD1B